MFKTIATACLLLAAIGSSQSVFAYSGGFVNYQSFDVSGYLQGGNKVDPKTTFSPIFESFGDYRFGDLYTYSIFETSLQNDYAGGATTYYYKLVPRLSLGKLLGKDISLGPFKDITFAQWISKTEHRGYNYFPGIGIDWQAPWIGWLRTIYYWERNPGLGWNDRRLHIDYGFPFSTKLGDFRIVGTFDHTFGLHGQAETTDFKPELHYDLGKELGQPGGHLWLGIVLNPIRNKYKIQSTEYFPTDQFSYGALIRYSFN
ncbi:UNVERIFIED_ORG: nucleoside-specific outer membrane channel protein Tsx [Burkholderia sp. 1263]